MTFDLNSIVEFDPNRNFSEKEKAAVMACPWFCQQLEVRTPTFSIQKVVVSGIDAVEIKGNPTIVRINTVVHYDNRLQKPVTHRPAFAPDGVVLLVAFRITGAETTNPDSYFMVMTQEERLASNQPVSLEFPTGLLKDEEKTSEEAIVKGAFRLFKDKVVPAVSTVVDADGFQISRLGKPKGLHGSYGDDQIQYMAVIEIAEDKLNALRAAMDGEEGIKINGDKVIQAHILPLRVVQTVTREESVAWAHTWLSRFMFRQGLEGTLSAPIPPALAQHLASRDCPQP